MREGYCSCLVTKVVRHQITTSPSSHISPYTHSPPLHCQQVCFASLSYGTLPALAATVHYYTGDERVGTDISFDLRQNCPDWPTSSAGVWQHVCINLNSCLRNYDEEGQMFLVGKLTFSGGTFWIDEFSISPGSIEGLNHALTRLSSVQFCLISSVSHTFWTIMMVVSCILCVCACVYVCVCVCLFV